MNYKFYKYYAHQKFNYEIRDETCDKFFFHRKILGVLIYSVHCFKCISVLFD